MANHDQGRLGDEMAPERDPQELYDAEDLDLAWSGLPAFEPATPRENRIVVTCDDEKARDEVISKLGLIIAKKTKGTWSAWYPPRYQEDLSSLAFEVEDIGSFTNPFAPEDEAA